MLQRCICLLFVMSFQLSVQASQTQISMVLDRFHQAASDANQQQYFDLLTGNAVFIGTDATERWDKKAFKAFVKPYFDKGKGWTYIPRDRHVTIAKSGKFAWFDEMLDSQSYGECRGTGVLELTQNGWKISQYHLTIPLPNALAKNIVKQIKAQQQLPNN